MSKEECENADWKSLGYSDGSRGAHYSHLEKRRKSCVEYKVAPDDVAYRDGWDQGIRRYCSYNTGLQAGSRGARHITYCPSDVAPDYLDGWLQGVRQYCQPENALKLGLSGHRYSGVCPTDMAGAFDDFYRLGSDVRQARAAHHELEERLDRTEHDLMSAKDPKQHRDLLHAIARLRHDENRSDARVIALEACMSYDWYDAGYRDGEDGQSARYRNIANTCRNYGIRGDRRGYLEGWRDGVSNYCSYDSGLYAGQNNLEYLGVCSGYSHSEFWRGYERGRYMFLHEQYEMHRKPMRKPEPRRPAAAESQLRHMPAARPAPTGNAQRPVRPAPAAKLLNQVRKPQPEQRRVEPKQDETRPAQQSEPQGKEVRSHGQPPAEHGKAVESQGKPAGETGQAGASHGKAAMEHGKPAESKDQSAGKPAKAGNGQGKAAGKSDKAKDERADAPFRSEKEGD